MKGITPVVAIILLLLITVAVIGFASIFLTGTIARVGEKTEEQLEAQVSALSKGIWIDSATDTAVIDESKVRIKNMGIEDINATAEINIYVDDIIRTECNSADYWDMEIITPGALATCTVGVDCNNLKVKASGPMNTHSVNCAF